MNRIALLAIAALVFSNVALCQEKHLDLHPKLSHLRSEPTREWSSFPEQAEGTKLEKKFSAKPNATEATLRIRQQDVKQLWRVLLNDKPLGELQRDEADILWYLSIPPKSLRDGENVLLIEAKSSAKPVADDIRVGELRIEPRPVSEVLSAAHCEIEVLDHDTKAITPARITIVAKTGALQQTSAKSNHELAVRPGVIYTASGRASFRLPAGEYVVYAGRGFEYSLAKMELKAIAGETVRQTLEIRREVPTPGFVACDTHIHTLTHSGHGDATIEERIITLAGEGIELPIATDHNKHIDYRPIAAKLGVEKYFTPVMGNEVTTSVGHFNIFPVAAAARIPNHQLKEWSTIFPEIFATPGVRVCILNHARDIHSNTRPFGPDLFNATIGENFAGWPMQFNAMEVINSGATRSETLGLLHDWMAVLNRGYQVTPVGSSDSHDVSRYIVGQGRTYIRCPDADVGKLDTETAVKNFLEGRVAVSYGLLVDLTLNGKFQPGDLAAAADGEVVADIRVLGPHWTNARKVQLYANGCLLRKETIVPPVNREQGGGVQWQGKWRFPQPKHDAHYVAIALGDGIDGPYWATAKPYQPTSPEFVSQTLGASGAVWLDGDGDGQRSSPRAYAEKLTKDAGDDIAKLAAKLKAFDEAVAAQATHLHLTQTKTSDRSALEQAIARSDPQVRSGMRKAWQAFRDQEIARAKAGVQQSGIVPRANPQVAANDLPAAKERLAKLALGWRQAKKAAAPASPKFPFSREAAQKYQDDYATWLGVPKRLPGITGQEFILIPPGEYLMGSPPNEPGRSDEHDETQHLVRLTEPFYLAQHETTVAQFRAFVEQTKYVTDGERNGGGHAHDDQAVWQHRAGTHWQRPGFAGKFSLEERQPAVHVSHADALAFAGWLTEQVGSDLVFTLPTEAEWEWACRAGTTTRFTWGENLDTTGKVANVGDRQLREVQPKWPREIMPMNDGHAFVAPVGSYEPNAFGLHDMLGNVWEFCSTRTGKYPRQLSINPGDLSPDRGFAVRGGGWSNIAQDVRSATRNADPPHFCHSNLGFRLALKIRAREK